MEQQNLFGWSRAWLWQTEQPIHWAEPFPRAGTTKFLPANPKSSQISTAVQRQELRNSFRSIERDKDLFCKKIPTYTGLDMAARRKCSVSKENSSFFYAELALPEDTGELNPPVCRERLPCQAMGRDIARGQEEGSFQELRRFLFQISDPFRMASQSLDSLVLPGHPASLQDGICQAEDGK